MSHAGPGLLEALRLERALKRVGSDDADRAVRPVISVRMFPPGTCSPARSIPFGDVLAGGPRTNGRRESPPLVDRQRGLGRETRSERQKLVRLAAEPRRIGWSYPAPIDPRQMLVGRPTGDGTSLSDVNRN